MSSPDHYSVLGVLPSADEVVIRAAYRALAQRYHPDKWQGDPTVANQKMAEINAAYAVLSDPEKKREYDQRQNNSPKSEPYYGSDANDDEPRYDPLRQDWEIAATIYPDLIDLNDQLAKLSWRLASGFRAYLLETKTFNERKSIAKKIETDYLERYFGNNPTLQNYAKSLLLNDERKAALELNRVVKVMGSDIEPGRVITLIDKKFRRWTPDDFPSSASKEEISFLKLALWVFGGAFLLSMLLPAFFILLFN